MAEKLQEVEYQDVKLSFIQITDKKTRRIAIAMNILTWKEEILCGPPPLDKELQPTIDC